MYHLHVYMHQPRRCNEQAVLWNQIDKHKIFSKITLFSNSKSDVKLYALGTRHVTINRHLKKGQNQRPLHKNLGSFLHNQKKFTVGQCFYCCFWIKRAGKKANIQNFALSSLAKAERFRDSKFYFRSCARLLLKQWQCEKCFYFYSKMKTSDSFVSYKRSLW